MKAVFKNAWGYQGDAMALPVGDLEAAVTYYERVFGFNVVARDSDPHNAAVMTRDNIRIGFAENGGDASQDGCAFEVDSVEAAYSELKANGLEKEVSEFSTEINGDNTWKVFYVIAPDGLCYWFGEKQAGRARRVRSSR